MAERLARSHERLMEMTYANCDQRLARILIELLGLDGERGWDTITEKPRCTTVPLTQAQLAALLCARRETVERSLRDWRARNIVTTGPRAVAVQDLEQLARLAGTTLARLRSAYEPEPDGGCSRDGWRNAN
jgi:CRP-like cAMP-binding protein